MDKNEIRNFIARRAAKELKDGDVVNLGIGLPTAIPNFLPQGVNVILQSVSEGDSLMRVSSIIITSISQSS